MRVKKQMETKFKVGSSCSSGSSVLPSVNNQQLPALAEAASSSKPLDTIYSSCDDSSDYKQSTSHYTPLSHCYQQHDEGQHFDSHEIVRDTVSE